MYTNQMYPAMSPGVAGEQALTSVANVQWFIAPMKAKIRRIKFAITTALNSTQAAVVNVYARSGKGVSAGQVLVGTLNIPSGSTVGQVIYKDVNVNLQEGYSLEFDVATVATTAGKGVAQAYLDYSPEQAANESQMVASS